MSADASRADDPRDIDDGYPAPLAYDPLKDRESVSAHPCWFALRLSDLDVYATGDMLPPAPPPLA